jgi:glycerol kinase
MQLQADVLNMPVIRANLAETTAFGAAKMAGMPGNLKPGTIFEPREPESWRAELKERWRDAVQRIKTL